MCRHQLVCPYLSMCLHLLDSTYMSVCRHLLVYPFLSVCLHLLVYPLLSVIPHALVGLLLFVSLHLLVSTFPPHLLDTLLYSLLYHSSPPSAVLPRHSPHTLTLPTLSPLSTDAISSHIT